MKNFDIYFDSIPHPFVGEYVRLRHNTQWKKLCISLNDQYIVFADIVNKITRSTGKVSQNKYANLSTIHHGMISGLNSISIVISISIHIRLLQYWWQYQQMQCCCSIKGHSRSNIGFQLLKSIVYLWAHTMIILLCSMLKMWVLLNGWNIPNGLANQISFCLVCLIWDSRNLDEKRVILFFKRRT